MKSLTGSSKQPVAKRLAIDLELIADLEAEIGEAQMIRGGLSKSCAPIKGTATVTCTCYSTIY